MLCTVQSGLTVSQLQYRESKYGCGVSRNSAWLSPVALFWTMKALDWLGYPLEDLLTGVRKERYIDEYSI